MSSRKAANSGRVTICAPSPGRVESRIAVAHGRFAAISTQPPLLPVLLEAFRHSARDKSVIRCSLQRFSEVFEVSRGHGRRERRLPDLAERHGVRLDILGSCYLLDGAVAFQVHDAGV